MARRWGVTSKWGRPRDRAGARAHADKEDGGPRCEAEKAPRHGIAASGAVPVRRRRQRARLLPHDHQPAGMNEGATGVDRSQPHAVAGKGAGLAPSPASPGPPLRRAPRPRPHRELCSRRRGAGRGWAARAGLRLPVPPVARRSGAAGA